MAKSKLTLIDKLKKNHFWILCPLAVVIAVAIFFLAYTSLVKAYHERLTLLDTLKKDVGTIASDSIHPNPETIENINKETDQLKSDVFNAWIRMYNDQKLKNQWPSTLEREFLDVVNQMKKFDNFSLPIHREFYQIFIDKHLPTLLDMIERRHVLVRRLDPVTGQPMDDPNGNPIWDPVDPYVIDPKSMVTQNSGGMGGGEMMGGGGMSGGSGGMGSGGGGMPGGSGGMRSGGGGGALGGVSGGNMMGGGMSSNIYSGGGDMTSGNAGSAMEMVRKSPYQKMEGIVDWPAPEIFTLVSWQRVPSSIQIWFAQEDLWVYEALIRVIQRSNQAVGAKENHTAAIKRIQSMLIGSNAASRFASADITSPLGAISSGGGFDDMMDGGMGGSMGMSGGSMGSGSMGMSGGGMGGMPGMSSMGGGMGMDGGGMGVSSMRATDDMSLLPEDMKKQMLYMYRYVDAELKPLMSEEEAPFAEFNMMPICLDLVIDQQHLPQILACCANCEMPIEVKKIRINPGAGKVGVLQEFLSAGGGAMGDGMGMSGGSMSMSGGGMPGMSGMSGSMGMSGGASGSSMGGSGGGVSGSSGMGAEGGMSGEYQLGGKMGPYGPEAIMVEIIGTINIYNEPDLELFATGTDAKGRESEGEERSSTDGIVIIEGVATTIQDAQSVEEEDIEETPVEDIAEETTEQEAEEDAISESDVELTTTETDADSVTEGSETIQESETE